MAQLSPLCTSSFGGQLKRNSSTRVGGCSNETETTRQVKGLIYFEFKLRTRVPTKAHTPVEFGSSTAPQLLVIDFLVTERVRLSLTVFFRYYMSDNL